MNGEDQFQGYYANNKAYNMSQRSGSISSKYRMKRPFSMISNTNDLNSEVMNSHPNPQSPIPNPHLSITINKNEAIKFLIDLINLYIEKITEMLNYDKFSKEYEKILISKRLSETCNSILNYTINLSISDARTVRIQQEDQNQEDEDEDFERDQGDRSNLNYFEKFGDKGIKVNVLSSGDYEYVSSKISIQDYMKVKNRLEDQRYKFYFKIIEIKEKLYKLKNSQLCNNEENFNINIGDTKSSINKLNFVFKSLYFNNIVNQSRNLLFSQIFNLNNADINFSNKCILNIIKFLNNQTFELNSDDIFEMLDISSYYMIDNLSTLIEIELEGIISKLD
jgi:hypothetical protein